jgi:hypothetical protein
MSGYIGFGKRISTNLEYPTPSCALGNWYGDVAFSSTSLRDFTTIPSMGHACMAINPNTEYLSALDKLVPAWDFTDTGVLKAATNGQVSVFPVALRNNSPAYPNKEILFELDGVYRTPCETVIAEDKISFGGKDHLVIPDIFRTNYYSYFAIETEDTP